MPRKLRYYEIMHAYQHPDVYAGPNCDQHRPRWIGSTDGDKDGDGEIGNRRGHIVLNPNTFPAGTRISVSVPCCPNCGDDADSADRGKCQCGFDWKAWAANEYA